MSLCQLGHMEPKLVQPHLKPLPHYACLYMNSGISDGSNMTLAELTMCSMGIREDELSPLCLWLTEK